MFLFDAFSGYGGFTIAAKILEIQTVGFSEINPYPNSVLSYHYPDIPNYGDIKEIDELPYFDILTGGFPCQDVSMAGRKQGISGTRSGLFFEFTKILEKNQPKYFILENVRGLLTVNMGADFARIQVVLSDLGYDIQWQLLNAKDFGVPQNRERIFIIGYHRDKSSRQEIFFEPSRSKRHYNKAGEKKEDSIKEIVGCLNSGGNDGGFRTEPGEHLVVSALTAYSGGTDVDDAQAGTLIVSDGVRRLTPLECERLMGLPDDYTKFGAINGIVKQISDKQRYIMLGNGVVPEIPRRILEVLCLNIGDSIEKPKKT
jgi:DNA (cytosine-5)-methyltransferase 1